MCDLSHFFTENFANTGPDLANTGLAWREHGASEGYSCLGALADAKALYNVYIKLRQACERYESPTKKQENKYLAKSLVQKYKDVQNKVVDKAKANHGISRVPYGKNCGRCIGHDYPVSVIKWKRPYSANNGRLCEVCNWAFNSRLPKGDRRRCGHKKFLVI